MMTVEHILKKYVIEAEVVDLEMIAARLKHHNATISVDNMILSDCGDNWKVELMLQHDDRTTSKHLAPTLRTAMADALRGLIVAQSD